MARPIVLSNGEMHVGLNEYSQVHDFYYPYVGGENHAAAHSLHHRIGIWVDGTFSWIDDGTWYITQNYLPETLIGISTLKNDSLGLLVEMTDTVDCEQAAFLRNIHIVNQRDSQRDIRLFMHQVFVISNSYASDTAQFLPETEAITHYKGLRTFIVGGSHADKSSFDQFVVGLNGIEGHEGSYRDAEDGELSGNTVEHGRVDSVIRFLVPLDAHDSSRVHYWIAAGKSQREALLIHQKIKDDGLLHRLLITDAYWKKWIGPAKKASENVPEEYKEKFIQNVLIIKSQIDKRGAVIASTDTTMLNYSKDSYSYCWPRDGAHVLWPLVRLGYIDEPMNYFMFCRRVLSSRGYLMHKYQADGALGSSWHPYIQSNGKIAPPIQEDESAIVLFLFSQYYAIHHDTKLLSDFYPTLIAPIANFLASYVQHNNLPEPSYDLWERLFLTSTYTTSVVYAALIDASKLADKLNNQEDSLRWRTAADEMKSSASAFEHNDILIKGIRSDGSLDETLDISSAYGAFMFGLFDDDLPATNTFNSVQKDLVSGDGYARFADDEYNRSNPLNVGNPWFISSLWIAQYDIENNDMDSAKKHIDWVSKNMLSTGVLAEQIDPDTNAFLSVAPLTWSQAEYVSTILDYIKFKESS